MFTKSLKCFVGLSLLAGGVGAFAQNIEVPAEVKTSESKRSSPTISEKIEVTGSRIKRIEAESTVPILTISRERIEQSGFSSVSDILREIPESNFGSLREQANRSNPGFAGVNLRGLGGKYTLVLLDGRRIATDPAFDAVDVGEIPIAMIERIEILKDGGSAVYGSDAVGGVVNIITRRDVQGVKVTTSASQPAEKGGGERKVEVVGGGSLGRAQVLVAASYRVKDEIYARDRSFVGDGWSTTGSPGSFVPITMSTKDGKTIWNTKGNFQADPRCQNTNLNRINKVAGDEFCEYNYESVRTIAPPIDQKAAMVKTELDFNDSLKIYALLKAGSRKAQDLIAALPATNVDVIDPQAVAAIKTALGSAGDKLDPASGDGVRINYRTTDLGLRDTRITEFNTTGVVGLKGAISNSWDWDFSYSASQIKREDEGTGGYWNRDVLISLIKEGKFNPFDPNESGESLADAAAVPKKRLQSDYRQATIVLNGDALDLQSGRLTIAMGASYSREDYKADADSLTLAGKIPGATSSKGSGDRDSNAVFVEAEAPLTKNWGIAAAGRLDSYSRYGTGFSPRLSSSFKTNDWLFRGSIGKGFRAPTLREESVSSSTVYPSFVDNFRCVQARESGNSLDVSGLCKESTYMLEIVTPDQLKTEKVTTGSLGTIYAPNSIFNLGIDIWYIQIKDRIGIPDLSLLTMAEAHGEYGYKNHGISIERDAKGRLLKVVSPASNLAKQEVSGLDVDAEVKVGNPRTFQVMWNLGSSYQLSNKEAAFEGQGLQERIGDADHPQWRAANTLTFTSLTDHQVSITGRTTSSMRKVNPDLGRLPVYTEYDSQCRMGHLFNGYIAFGALNITNSKPPEDDSSSPSLNYDIYSYAGRTFYASVGQAF